MLEVNKLVVILEEKKAQDIQILDFKNVSSLFDYFIICTAQNIRQIQALVDAIELSLKQENHKIRSIEGKPESGWVLVDLYDVIIHIFTEGQRDYYQLEKLWMGLEVK